MCHSICVMLCFLYHRLYTEILSQRTYQSPSRALSSCVISDLHGRWQLLGRCTLITWPRGGTERQSCWLVTSSMASKTSSAGRGCGGQTWLSFFDKVEYVFSIMTVPLIGLPWQLSSKESACQCGSHEFNTLVWEDALEKEMASHSSTLAWEPPWTEGPGGYILGVTKSQTRLSDSAPALCDGPHPGLWSVSLNKSHFLR